MERSLLVQAKELTAEVAEVAEVAEDRTENSQSTVVQIAIQSASQW